MVDIPQGVGEMLAEAEEAEHKVKDTAEAKEEEDSKAHKEGASESVIFHWWF